MEQDSLVSSRHNAAGSRSRADENSGHDATAMAAAGLLKNEPAVSPHDTGWLARLKSRFPILRKKRGLAFVILIMFLPLFGLLGLLALRRGGSGPASGVNAQGAITSDTHFYGESEPVYPSPEMTGTDPWLDSFNKASVMVQNMTIEEKVSLTTGASSQNGCVGWIPAVPRLGFSGLCLQDAGQGVRNADFVSGWPSGIHVGASWNKNLTRQRAVGMGVEFKIKGVNVALGPVVGPVGRVIRGGRNWEGFSVDPYLCGALAYETVSGIHDAGVISSTKHFIANEQETNRVPSGGIEAVSSNIDDKTMHELYLCKTQNGLLKTELGFQGFVVSDWGAQHAGVATALAGMDMVMPSSSLWGNSLVTAVKNGSVPESRVDDMAIRILASWYQMKQDSGFPDPGVGLPADLTKPHTIVDARETSSKQILLDGAIEGHVLLKNTNNALPLKKPKILSLYGYSATVPGQWVPGSQWTGGHESALGGSDTMIAPNGTIVSGGGSGAVTPSYISAPFDALNSRAIDDGTALFWDFFSSQPTVSGVNDACLIFGNVFASEGVDRPGIYDDYTDNLIQHVADKCSNTIVIFQNAGLRLVDKFVDHPNVTALIFAHLPGQDSGRALVSLLYGESNPSGKLPYTVAHDESDYEKVLDPDLPEGMFVNFPQSNFSEGVYIDYRHFDARNITPRYEFGFGLSYTTFKYSNLGITKKDGADTSTYPTGNVAEGGQTDLWDILATVTADIQNTGGMDGAEVAQLYVGIPGAPAKQLRGFDKPSIKAGQSATVSLDLTRRDLSVWDVVAQKWMLQNGTYIIYVGASSRDLPLQGTLVL